jgi:hypothetical protein
MDKFTEGYFKMIWRKILPAFLSIIFLGSFSARSQDEDAVHKLFREAIEAMGGETYLAVKDIVSEGQFFVFNSEGDSSGLIKFSDYTKLPDKSRSELGNSKKEMDIRVFNLERNEGWIREGQKETRAAKPDEMKDFKAAANHSLDNIFHFRYKDPQNKIFYLGPGDGTDMMLELVKIIDPENDEITVYFDRLSKLPVKVESRRLNNKGVRQRVVDEYSQWHVIQGVNTPLRVDGFINGRRDSQQFITKITFNNNLQDEFFSKPVPLKK